MGRFFYLGSFGLVSSGFTHQVGWFGLVFLFTNSIRCVPVLKPNPLIAASLRAAAGGPPPGSPLPRRRGRPSRRCSPGVGAAVVAAGGSCVPRPCWWTGSSSSSRGSSSATWTSSASRWPAGAQEHQGKDADARHRRAPQDLLRQHRGRAEDQEVRPTTITRSDFWLQRHHLIFSWQWKLLHVVIVHALVILHSQRWS